MSVIRDLVGAAALAGLAFLGGAAVEGHLAQSGQPGVLEQLQTLIAAAVDAASDAASGASGDTREDGISGLDGGRSYAGAPPRLDDPTVLLR